MSGRSLSILKVIPLLILFSGLSRNASAQKIEVGDYFNNLGSLRNASTEWKTTSFPLKLVLMYYNGKTTINGNAMNWLITPAKEVGLDAEDVKLVVGQGRSWAAMKYDFTLPGSYTISAFDREWAKLATTVITIEGPKKEVAKPKKEIVEPIAIETKTVVIEKKQVKETPPEPIEVAPLANEELTPEEEKTLKYETFYIAFGRAIRDGMLTGQNEKFKAVPGGNYVEVLFSNNEGFEDGRISVDVWLKPKGGTDYTEHVTEKKISVPQGALESNFHLSFFKRGSYKVSLYTEKFVWIGTGYVALY